ncbi:hypothetical protein [uncultured Paludibaculum sp.]|uniref:hypothetical protein n=1 Tax=uncultured Paludibaculum sp. TaxID=1765020 RepID=UPI002AAC2B7C|nr:hypothetical protein [uncultured Paludibaculum sp.]
MTDEKTSSASCGNCFCSGAGPAMSEFLRKIGPPEGAKHHFDTARIEFLKGIRALIDARIENLSQPESKGTKVPVE